jgi:hypothetical protein
MSEINVTFTGRNQKGQHKVDITDDNMSTGGIFLHVTDFENDHTMLVLRNKDAKKLSNALLSAIDHEENQ